MFSVCFDITLPLSTTRAAASSDCGMTPFSVPKVFTTDDTGDGTDIPCVFSARTKNMYDVAGFNSPTYTTWGNIHTPDRKFIFNIFFRLIYLLFRSAVNATYRDHMAGITMHGNHPAGLQIRTKVFNGISVEWINRFCFFILLLLLFLTCLLYILNV